MNQIQQFEQYLISLGFKTKMDAPMIKSGTWWLNVKGKSKLLEIIHNIGNGFGLSVITEESAFGMGADEWFEDIDSLTKRTIELLNEP